MVELSSKEHYWAVHATCEFVFSYHLDATGRFTFLRRVPPSSTCWWFFLVANSRSFSNRKMDYFGTPHCYHVCHSFKRGLWRHCTSHSLATCSAHFLSSSFSLFSLWYSFILPPHLLRFFVWHTLLQKRHMQDNELNRRKVLVWRDGAFRTLKWLDVVVGDIVQLRNNVDERCG